MIIDALSIAGITVAALVLVATLLGPKADEFGQLRHSDKRPRS